MRCETVRIAIAASALVAVGISAPTSSRAETGVYMKPPMDLAAYYAQNLGLGEVGSDRLDIAQARTEERAAGKVVQAAHLAPGGAGRILLALADVPQVSSSTLATMRGGFELPNGMTVSFGFDIANSIANQAGGPPISQVLNIQGTATGSTVSGTVTTQNQGGSTITVPLTAGGFPVVSLVTIANGGQTSLSTSIGSGGLLTLISNNAANQIIQHTQTLNVDITGMLQMLSQQAQQAIISKALNAGTMFGKR